MIFIQEFHEQFRENIDYGFWFAFAFLVGPGLVIFQDLDFGKISSADWPDNFNSLVQKWIEEHPGSGELFAEEIVSFINDYEKLTLSKDWYK